MQYAWYEIVGMSILVGIIVFLVFRGLDLALEWFLARMQDRRDRQAANETLDEVMTRFNAWKNRPRG